ncbi:ParB/RepB/Spo0J family partition protein [Nitrospirillum amazonense]|uniref:ParB/RepB/Spo0J family partition protein n=1 Tax=Nitrospirillum amazonense TaxID=28077 RepID=UPI002412DE21|nr:ParB/RepB/Spo0J family partition protein [Nitrospirillum amazonense]MDG3444694.1 ParB/RepB/Spo0J family partition protein [Nitrospirillum amazonense]
MVNDVQTAASAAELEIDIGDIDVGERLRGIDPNHAQVLAVSMSQRGQIAPVMVRRRAGRKGARYALVAGAHRLEAANLLSWRTIKAVLFEGSETEALLAEIDENLIRHELTPLDRATFMAERKRIYEELHPETKHGGDRRSEGFQNDTVSLWSFTKDTAERCGLHQRTIERAVQIATKLSAEAKRRVAGTWLAHKQGELLALCALTPEEQKLTLDLLLAPEPSAKTVEAAAKVVKGVRDEVRSSTDRQVEKLKEAWARAGAPAQRAFLDFLRETGALSGKPQLEEVA